MTEVTTIKGGLNNIGFMRHTVSEKGKNIIVCTLNSGNKWLFLSNPNYEENIEDSKTDKEFYKSPHQVPKYSIFKNGNKIGIAMPREFLQSRFLYIPTPAKEKRNFYIFDIDDEYNINKDARLMFDV